MPDEYRMFRMPAGAGRGRPPYLLLRGVGLSHRSYTRAAKLLSRSAEVIAIDLPGFGGTRRPEHPRSVEQYAGGIAELLDRADVGPVVVVGHSMGAQFAL
ncbi:alpha/beta fold hydrolase [Subtercola sp. YIM 133946]|uniref:alpha/beta fold hydrolase n=1 Tax=Subtercola sp. YIM 133946 TaxID=3118909 RepID=UPI002F94D2F5